MTSFFNFAAQPVEVEIKLAGEDDRRQVEVKGEKDKKELCPVYYDGESVVGQVNVRVKDGKKFQHDGVRIELIGSIGECARSSTQSAVPRILDEGILGSSC